MTTTMNATIEGGRVSLDLYDLMGNLNAEQRASVIDALACQNEVITEVANQILDGWTTDGSHGPKGCGGNPDATHGIDGARMRIAKASSEVAAKEIAALAEQLKRMEARINEGWDAYHEVLRHRSGGF